MKATKNVVFMPMRYEHLPQVLVIEQCNGQQSNPIGGSWTKEDFKSVLATANHQGIIGLSGSKIIAFAIYCLYISISKIHIANMAVHANFLRQGFGSQTIMKLKSKLMPKRLTSLEIDIKESNLAAQLFLRSRDFLAVNVCRNWYKEPVVEDAYKFRYKLED